MTTSARRPVASLWIGEKLHYLNQLCLLSHVRNGHPTTLYCTDTVTNVPAGIEVRPASDIMAIDMEIVRQTYGFLHCRAPGLPSPCLLSGGVVA